MRVLVFGASTVQGYWDSHGGWADRLKGYYDKIQMDDLSKDIPHVMNLGVSGDGSAELLGRIDNESKARRNDKGTAIIISIGTNSAAILNGEEISSYDEFREELVTIIKLAKKHTNKILMVGLPAVDESKTNPIQWADMCFRNERIASFEDIVEQTAAQQGVGFVGIHKIMNVKNSEGLQSHDGLHPNDAGHQLIFELVRPELDKLLAA